MSQYQSRFSQVIYDEERGRMQWMLRQEFIKLESAVRADPLEVPNYEALKVWVDKHIPEGRGNWRAWVAVYKAQHERVMDDVLCALEEAYMWFGKAIRDDMLNKPKLIVVEHTTNTETDYEGNLFPTGMRKGRDY